MRKTITYFIAVASLFMSACSKKEMDAIQEKKVPMEQLPTSSFFRVSPNAPQLIKRIASAFEQADTKEHFAGKFSRSLGMPVWDKYTASLNDNSRLLKGGTVDTTVLIPLVKDSQKVVSSFIAFVVKKDAVQFNVYRGSSYKFYPYALSSDELTAPQIAIQMMALQRNVFGDSTFTILDDQLFPFIKKKDRNGKRTIVFGPSKNAAYKVEQVITVTCYDITYDGDEGQLVGVAPGETNNYGYTIEHICVASSSYIWTPDDYSGGGGNGGGNPSSGGSGGGSGSDPCGPTENNRTARIVDPGDCGGGTGWEPSPFPPLSGYDWDIINNLAAEMKDVDDHWESPCHSTARLGNIKFQGTIEHWVIQLDYLTSTPGANVEYYIPGAGQSGTAGGYADMVNSMTNDIFEIKPNNRDGIDAGRNEVANYVAKATANCGNGTYQKGTVYDTRYLPNPKDPSKVLMASLKESGVIVYESVDKQLSPVPVTIPDNIRQKIKDLVKKILAQPTNFEPIMLYWLKMNPEVVTYIKGAAITVAVGLVVGTIIEDIATAGVGVADDWESFLMAYKLVRLAVKL